MLKKCLLAFLIALILHGSAIVTFAQKIYLFSEGDVHDRKVGNAVAISTNIIITPFINLLPRERIEIYNNPFGRGAWNGPNIRRSNNVKQDILKAIQNCPAGPDDTIFFYWCGHGSFDEKGHFLWMPENRGEKAVYRSEILNALKDKNVRLIVFMTESCNVYGDFPFAESAPGQMYKEYEIPLLFQSLFFDYKGVLDFNTSSAGQTAKAINKGGVYTYFFSDMLSYGFNESSSWEEMFDSIDSIVSEMYQQKTCVWSWPEKSKNEKLVNRKIESGGGPGGGFGNLSGQWTEPKYHPENGDLIIAVNDIPIQNEAHFRQVIQDEDSRIVLTVIDHKSGKRYYLMTDLRPRNYRTRLGIYITDDYRGGVRVTGTMRRTPGNQCRFLQHDDGLPDRTSQQSTQSYHPQKEYEDNSYQWSAPNFHPENDDLIIAVNDIEIRDEAHFRQVIRDADTRIVLTVIDHKTGNRYYLRTDLRPTNYTTRLGIFITDDYRGGVRVTGITDGTPGNRCSVLQNSDGSIHSN